VENALASGHYFEKIACGKSTPLYGFLLLGPIARRVG
jgi:hypothetical protein